MEDRDLLQRILEYLVVRDNPEPADAVFIFGSVLQTAVWVRAANLFHLGLAPVILTTGYAGPNAKALGIKSEGSFLAAKLVECGVPREVIIVEERSTNTLENVVMGMEALAKQGIVPKTVLLVAKPFHMRRCVATFAKQRPAVRVLSCPPEITLEQMIDRPFHEFAHRVVGEIDRIVKYSKDGRSIAPQIVPEDILKIADQLRPKFTE